MTIEQFVAFYPQFTNFEPAVVVQEFLDQANARFGDFGPDTNEARRLFMAHKLTLYAFTALPADAAVTMEKIAAAGKAQGSQQISSKKVDDVQISYASSSNMSASASTSLADLTETEYGMQLLTLIRQHSRSRYVR